MGMFLYSVHPSPISKQFFIQIQLSNQLLWSFPHLAEKVDDIFIQIVICHNVVFVGIQQNRQTASAWGYKGMKSEEA